MQAQITKEDDIIIIRLHGISDVESVADLDQACKKYCLQKKVIFNLADLNFVGSSGLDKLIGIISTLSHTSQIKICSARKEFQRIFATNLLGPIEICENEAKAKKTLQDIN